MAAGLYIASKPTPLPVPERHLYLVYDLDGSLSGGGTLSGDELVFRGGPSFLGGGQIIIESGMEIFESEDGQNGNASNPAPTYAANNFTLLASGSAAETMWAGILEWGASIIDGEQDPGSRQDTVLPYSTAGSHDNDTNSNSVVASALASVGVAIYSNLPVLGGDIVGTARLALSLVPGATTLLSGSQSNIFNGGSGNVANLFMDAKGHDGLSGNDVFYGGADGIRGISNPLDKDDMYVQINSSGGPIAWTVLMEGTIPVGIHGITPDGKADSLYSIENIYNKSFADFGTFNFSNVGHGVNLNDLVEEARDALNDDMKPLNNDVAFIDTAVTVDLGGGDVVMFANIGGFTATAFADAFNLNQVIGRTFDGVGGRDGVSYNGVTDFAHGGGYSFGYNAGTLDVIRSNATGPTDTLTSIMRIETTMQQDYIGLVDLSNTTSTDRLVLVGSAPLTSPDIVSVAMAGGHGGYFEFDTSSGKQAGAVFEFDYAVNPYEMFVSLGTSSREDGIYNDLTVHGLEAGDAVNVAWNQSHVWAGYGMTGVNIGGFTFDTLQLVDYLGDFASNDGTNNSAPEALRGEWRVSYLSEAVNFWFINLGNAYYHVNEGDGTTVIDDANGVTDSVKFGVNVSASSVGYTKTGTDLTIAYGTLGDSVVVQDFFNAATTSHRIEKVQFANGTVHGLPFILEQVFTQNGTAAADVLTGVDYAFDPKDYLYGLGGNDTLNGGAGADNMVGGLGDDTYIVDNTGDSITENAAEGTDSVSSSVSYTLSDNIENLTLSGSGDLNGTGNSQVNVITGNSGNNTLDGGAGADTLIGGTGNDAYVTDNAGDVLIENASEGTDTVQSSVDWTLGANFENLALTGSSNINGSGNGAVNVLTGNSGNNTLDGSAGADTMIGGTGDDSYIVDNASDVISENASEGTDTVLVASSYTLGSNIDNLILTGSGNINGTGNNAVNVLTGNSGNNTLDGGAGADTMIGGAGNDTYVVDDTSDVINELTGEGTDTVQSSVSYTLSAYVENVVLTGSSALAVNGNALDNTITGNSAASTLAGGNGSDTYLVNTSAVVVENASEGIDTVILSSGSTGSYTLGANIENLDLSATTVTGGTGNALDNSILGNSAVNTLSGGDGNDTLNGGIGADTMIGGAGNDVYVLDNASEVIVESSGAGTDTVLSSIYCNLSDHAWDIENLTLTGTSAINGFGNFNNNIITGNSNNNTLSGEFGNDTLYGAGGNDTLDAVNGAGTDALFGGDGNDSYFVDSDTGDIIVEYANEGIDTVYATLAWTLGANLENLTYGQPNGDFVGTGNEIDNVITGKYGNDTLDGGAGADTLIGGFGNDLYIIDANDLVSELASGGTDTIQTGLSYTLADNLENLILTGSSNLNGTGNTAANTLTGNSGNNTLDGGVGADALLGGLGDDVYLIDNASDTITESASAGTDTAQAGVSYTISTNVENLTLTGSSNLNGTGNSGANTLTGNSGNNTLDGGTGADTLLGGAGDDVYVVDNAGDAITESASEGTDLVQSSVNFSIASFANVENLTLTGTATSATGNSGSNILIGNSSVNVLTGNDGNDTLDGASGADTLDGGAGDDKYIVDNVSDVILNANETSGTDTVESNVTFSLAALSNIENLTLTGSTAVTATGSSGNNLLSGELNSAANSLVGGTGDDSYYIGTGDIVVEAASAGTDTVYSGLSTYTLTTNVENLVLTGTGNISGTGNTAANTLTGNSGNNTLSGGTGADTLIGGAGDDTYLVDNAGDAVSENSAEGTDTVSSSVTFSLAGSAVENLTLTGTTINGTGNDLDNTLTGSSSVNILTGAGGNDYLDGGAGADTMIGGTGDDTFVVSVSTDVLSENAGEGTDLVISVVTHTLAANFENLTLTGATALNGTGNGSVNILTGNTGINSLNGMAGADTMVGGAGNDIYFVDDAGDIVIELSAEGTDAVQSGVSYTLTSNVENLTLTGSGNNNATGNSAVNTLTGNTGNNTLDGGAGADAMVGGTGNDTYLVDDAGDTVTEAASAGTDLVLSSVSFTLGTNLENLTLTGSGNIDGTGNTVVNTLTGNSGNNTLSGGTGADTLIGGAGDDTYFVDNAGDVVSENASEGTDTVSSTVTFSLASLSNIEHLTLTGSSVIDATGNGLANILTGNAVKNILSGGGGNDTIIAGGGADTMLGGTGDDLYIVSVTSSVITENASEGTDSVQSSVTYTLSAEVENLTLTAATAINGTGNASANILIGGSGTNTLSGAAGNDTLDGGAGTDTLTGGTNADTFVFKVASYGGIDTVTDFSTAQSDVLDIRDLLSGFNPGSHAITDWVRITDVSGNSKVEVDRDGTGGTYGWSQIATLTGVTGLTDEAALVSNGTLLAA